MTMFFFDHFDHFEMPNISLENPDGTVLYNLGTLREKQLELRYNSLSKFTFIADAKINDISVDFYDFLEYRRIVDINGYGKFMISEISETNNGIEQYKTITCFSRECELNTKKISLLNEQYPISLNNAADPNPTLMDRMFAIAPDWSIGTIDAEAGDLYRSFNVSDQTVYSFLTNEASNTYQCIFIFDSIAKTISAKSLTNATTATDIYMDTHNLIENLTIKESTSELVTALSCFGAGNLSIAQVNPLGTPVIYNFDYYKSTDWMSQELINDLNNWENKIIINQPIYANHYTDWMNNDASYLDQYAFLIKLQTSGSSSLAVLQDIQKVRIQQAISTNSYTDGDGYVWTNINEAVKSKETDIVNQEIVVNQYITTASFISGSMIAINNDLSFTNTSNFSASQLSNLGNFIVGSTYTNSNYVEYDNMSASAIKEEAQNLYNQAAGIQGTTTSGNWNSISAGLPLTFIHGIEINPVTPEIMYAGSYGSGVFKTINSGVSWYPINSGLSNLNINSIEMVQSFPNILYVTTSGSGIFKSTDSGTTWNAINTGITDLNVIRLVVDPTTSSMLYAGTHSNGVFKTVNSGTSWSAINSGLTDLYIECLSIDPLSIIYAGTLGTGIFKTTDGGTSWNAINTGLTTTDVLCIAINPIDSAIIYAGSYGGGIFKSIDSGANWSSINTGLTYLSINCLAIDSNIPSIIYCGTDGNGVFRSSNSGANWNVINTGILSNIISLAIHPLMHTTLFAGTLSNGILTSVATHTEGILDKISQPRYTFEITGANFVFLKEFQKFIDQLVLGCTVTLKINDTDFAYPALLGIDLNFDDPTQFKMTFSNRLRLNDSSFEFNDLMSATINNGITTTFNSPIWSNWDNNYKDDVSNFITSALDASKNAVVNARDQSFIIDTNGLRGRQAVDISASPVVYKDEQLWMVNNMLAFTKDNWQTSSLALGKIISPISGSTYGLVADTIVGHLIAGNNLLITNSDTTFSVSGSMMSMTNGAINLTGNSNKNRILLDPTNGIKIQKFVTPNWNDQFYVDASGSVVFAGDLQAVSGTFSGNVTAVGGTIGGFTIDGAGIRKDATHYLNSNGDMQWGILTIAGGVAIFNGTIYAANLGDYVQDGNMGNISAAHITSGTMSADRIYGGVITWSGGSLDINSVGLATITTSQVDILGGGGSGHAGLHIESGGATIWGNNHLSLEGETYVEGWTSSDEAILHIENYTSGKSPKIIWQNTGNTNKPKFELQLMPADTDHASYMRWNYSNDSTGTTDLWTIDGYGNVSVWGHLYVHGDQTGAMVSAFSYDDYDDLDLLEKWRKGETLPFEYGDILNQNKLLRDAIIQLSQRVIILEKGK